MYILLFLLKHITAKCVDTAAQFQSRCLCSV